jgi:hypothetical protein
MEAEEIALSSDPDWERGFPKVSTKTSPVLLDKREHPATREDFLQLEECGRVLARHMGWGPLNGVALRESGMIAAQRYGYSAGNDAALAEEAFSLLLAAL